MYIYIHMSIILKQPTMWLATFFLVNLVMRWNGHVFFSIHRIK